MKPDETTIDEIARAQLDHINGDLKEIKQELKEQRKEAQETREIVVSVKTELRIWAAISLLVLSAIIGILINHLATIAVP